ncbi:GNAT family N-acetyltransferase [Undibacterium rugosum]|uniref:GNAT family N-acetyltransferase n=1 Tax=Undibacterium rugosum TaxID=2762291 RepID=A0A923KYS8_9BURK|nr:GNAT family N-acetyltransferase [Undibacterium rugosum]MBC3933816.1 GNAT family N-acetyltransferase [Undibacterium rugosum]MBR7777519.1 GNAT family N-acetyltransferase [Undibacterium rugosum]
MQIRIRAMRVADVSAVYAVQAQVYVADMVEPQTLLLARLQVAPDSAWVAEDEAGVGAYLAGYPSVTGKISALGADFAPAFPADALYLHDMAVAPRMAGQGVAARLFAAALQLAKQRDYAAMCLVSVQNTLPFWRHFGFAAQNPVTPEQQALLASYSGDAYYCIRHLL